tara:strand:+ start:514 stop:783 length:270 start_codon:yes stop_codon:yes gene_type:complete
MISLLLLSSSFLNFIFYIYAIGFVVALVLEQIVRKSGNERNIYIVEYNRKYLWRNAWVVNILWFITNIGLYLVSRNMQPAGVDHFWDGI